MTSDPSQTPPSEPIDETGPAPSPSATEGSPDPAPIGSVIDGLPYVERGRYATRELLGEGGMGRVEQVYDRHLERDIAIKTLRDVALSARDRAIFEARFIDEARVTGQLEHPNIVPVYDVGRQPDGAPYFAMKQIKGRTLTQALADRSFQDRLRMLPRFVHVCQAMAYAHSRGIIHRDLKPDNVMLGDFGETLVVDWGLSKVRAEHTDPAPDSTSASVDGRTRAGQVMGTPAYMSPEQARGETDAVDARTDVWALGVILFQSIAGRLPFRGRTHLDLIRNLQRNARRPLVDIEPKCPPALAAIVDKALQPDPDDRYPDAGALTEDLERFLADDLVRAHEYTPSERLGRFLRRHRLLIAVLVTLLVAAGGAWRWQSMRIAAAEEAERAALTGEMEALTGDAREVRPQGWISQYAARLAALSSRLMAASDDDTLRRAALRPLIALLTDRDPAMRRLGAQALGLTGRDDAAEPLLARLKPEIEDDESVVIDVIRALGVLGVPRAEAIVQHTRLRYGTQSYVGVNTQVAALMLPTAPPGPDANSDAWADHGYSLVSKGRRGAGLEAYAKALDLSPDNPRALINRGLTLRRMGRYRDALADYARVLALDIHPLHRATTLLNRSTVYRVRGEYAAALADLDRMLAMGTEPHQIPGRRARAYVRWTSGDHVGARADIEAALAPRPDDRATVTADARSHIAAGRFDTALARLNDAVALDAENALSLRYRSWAHRLLGDRAAARADLDRALSIEPNVPDMRAERLGLAVAAGDLDTAQADEARLLEEHSTRASVFAAAGVRLHAARGDWPAAAERLDRAVEKASPGARSALVLLRRAVGTRLDAPPGPLPAPSGEVAWHDRMLAVAGGEDDPIAAAADAVAVVDRCFLRLAVVIRDADRGTPTVLPPATGHVAGQPELPELACDLVEAMGLPR